MISEPILSAAEAAQELKRRVEDSKLFFYRPCCRAHKNNCPVLPCPDSKHSNFHVSKKRIRAIFGGNRSGKSTTALAEFLMSCCFKTHPFRKTPNAVPGNYRIYSTDFGIIEKLIIPMVKEWIPVSALRGTGRNKEEAWENSYDAKFHLLKLKRGTIIDFMSYDQDSSKSESVPLDGVMADEQMPEKIYAAALARLVSRNGWFLMAVTPLYDLSWAMTFLESVDPQVEVFHFDIRDNPHLSEQAILDFEASVPEHEKEARLHGRFLELQGLVYKELRRDVHLLGEERPRHGEPIIMTMDPHPRKATVMTWAYVTGKGDIIFFDELEMRGTARDIASAIRAKESKHPAPPALRLIDPAAKAQGNSLAFETDTLREFEREGMSFSLADNSEAGYNVVHEYLGFDVSKPLGAFNRPRCFFSAGTPKTWYGMTHLLWDEWNFRNTLKDEKERVRDYNKDFPDCVRYTLAVRPTHRTLVGRRVVPIGNLDQMKRYARSSEVRSAFVPGRTAA